MRSDGLRLQDILDAINIIIRDTPRQDFDLNEPLRSHILLQIMIIGEAVTRLSEQLRDKYPAVPWRPIMRMRNIIAHVYFRIDWDQVWEVAVRDVAVLKPQIEARLSVTP